MNVSDFSFQYPFLLWSLLALPLLFLLYIAYRFWKGRMMKRVGEPRLVRDLMLGSSPLRAGIRFSILLLAFAAGCLALANPRRPGEGGQETRKGIDIMVALDVSNSMLATDLPPNRLERAKAFIARLIARSPNDRIGLVLFAGNAYIQMPLTFDHGAARLYSAAAHPTAIAAQGTNIGDALEKSALAFELESERFKTIVLISDGEAHDEAGLEKARELSTLGFVIHTIGIGSPGGGNIIDPVTRSPKTDASGTVVLSRLNEKMLADLAQSAKGTYIHLAGSEEAVSSLRAQFAQIEKKSIGDVSLLNYETYYAWLLVPMLLLLILELFIPDRKKGFA